MTDIQIGAQCKLLRPTFLHQGVFILQHSIVTVQKIEGDEIVIEWQDREGGKHLLSGVHRKELSILNNE